METLARHLELAKSHEKEPGGVESFWLLLPRVLVRLSGLAVGLELVLAALKLEVYVKLPWSTVLLPVIITLCIVFVVTVIAVVMWIRTTMLIYYGDIDIDPEELRLDVILRTAKICFMSNAYAMLLMVSLGLLLAKLQFWPGLPVVYPALPLIMLGMVYIILGVMLKQPEVDSPWYVLIGVTVLCQSIMLAIKLDLAQESHFLPWAATFIPSWTTYVILLAYSAMCALFETLNYAQVQKLAGITSWAIGWGLSQTLFCLRVDAQYKVAWLAVVLPALLGWILLLIFVTKYVSDYFEDLAQLLLDTFSFAYIDHDVEEEWPLLGNSPPRHVN